jgi:hypothetical protein
MEGLGLENVGMYILWPFGIFYGYLEYFLAIWKISLQFEIFYGHLECFMVI